jgi:histidine triad (HIT) family protein
METDCIFCNIAQEKTSTELLYKNKNLVVFKDIKPHAPVHLLIVPKQHIRSINDLTEADMPLVSELIQAAKNMAIEVGVRESGYKLVFNVERGGGQMVFHLHLHLIGGFDRGYPV